MYYKPVFRYKVEEVGQNCPQVNMLSKTVNRIKTKRSLLNICKQQLTLHDRDSTALLEGQLQSHEVSDNFLTIRSNFGDVIKLLIAKRP